MCLASSESNGKSEKVHPRDCAMQDPSHVIRQAIDLDLVGRDPTADGVGLTTGITPATRAAVLAFVSLQLIELVRLPVTGHARGRGAHAALSTSGVWRVGHQLSTVISRTCQGPTAGERE